MYDIYRTDVVVRQRDLDQEFLGREYLLDTRDIYQDDLEGRSIFSLLGALGYVVSVFPSMYIVQTHWHWILTFGSIAKQAEAWVA